MPRYRLTIEYDGTPFAGWQIQVDQVTVQGVLTAAVEALTGEKTLVQGAGRTDAGVHARAQVAHVDLARDWETDTVRDALNAHLRPHPVAVLAAERVADDFNARTSARQRHYRYRILNRRADLTLDLRHAWRVPRPLDAAAMHEAAQRLVGKHDFTTFRSTECQAQSPVKTLDRLDVERHGEEVIVLASALVPAQPGALHGRLAGRGGRGQMARRRSQPGAGRVRPRPLRSGGAAGRAVSDAGGLLRTSNLILRSRAKARRLEGCRPVIPRPHGSRRALRALLTMRIKQNTDR